MSDDALKIAKKKLELQRVKLGLNEMEFKIMERKADIERIEKAMVIQKKRISELENEIKGDGDAN